MQVGIDWVATGVLVVAYVLSQIRTLPLKLRHFIFAGACFFVAAWRLRLGTAGYNVFFVGLAVVLGLMYAVRGFKAPKQP